MKRSWLAILLCALPFVLGQASPSKPTLYIIHADWCAPCLRFDRVYQNSRSFRDALHDAFVLRELDWMKPAQQAEARRLGVTDFPSFIAMRGNRVIANHKGFADNDLPTELRRASEALLLDLGVEWPPAERPDPPAIAKPSAPTLPPTSPPPALPAPAGEHIGPTIDQHARDGIDKLASQTRDLQAAQAETADVVESLQDDLTDVRSKIGEVRSHVEQSREVITQQLNESRESTHTELRSISERLHESIERVSESKASIPESIPVPATSSAPDISTEMPPHPTASKWLQVGKWMAGTALKVGGTAAKLAAPEYAIPLSVGLSVAGWLATRVRNRKRSRPTSAPRSEPPASGPVVPSAAAPQTVGPEFELDSLPFQDIDYTTSWADHWVREGKSPELAAKEYAGYVQAFDALARGELKLPGVEDGELFTKQVRNWVARQFKARTAKSPDTNNPNHRAFFAFLHKQAFENIRNGKFNEAAPNPKAADVLEDWVNSKIVGELVFNSKG